MPKETRTHLHGTAGAADQDGDLASWDDIADELDVTREAVRQTALRAFAKIRRRGRHLREHVA